MPLARALQSASRVSKDTSLILLVLSAPSVPRLVLLALRQVVVSNAQLEIIFKTINVLQPALPTSSRIHQQRSTNAPNVIYRVRLVFRIISAYHVTLDSFWTTRHRTVSKIALQALLRNRTLGSVLSHARPLHHVISASLSAQNALEALVKAA